MKHIGSVLKAHIEARGLKKRDVAESAGITYNYLSTIFKQDTCDAGLLERLCKACSLNPSVMFDVPDAGGKHFSDIVAHSTIGNATVQIGQVESLQSLLAEKERTIQILMSQVKTMESLLANTGTKTGQLQ